MDGFSFFEEFRISMFLDGLAFMVKFIFHGGTLDQSGPFGLLAQHALPNRMIRLRPAPCVAHHLDGPIWACAIRSPSLRMARLGHALIAAIQNDGSSHPFWTPTLDGVAHPRLGSKTDEMIHRFELPSWHRAIVLDGYDWRRSEFRHRNG